ncbi:MAG TPA: tetratricopeptide repeat protein [Rhodothermales bacterium]|nr:tetratricopeptide repeat protein [Rhodothermales bacterium]
MSPERLEQIQSIYLAALDQPSAERAAFLDDACGEDADLHEEVASLLAADAHGNSMLEQPLADVRGLMSKASDEPRRVGPYRIVEEIGRGGMGAVYLAARDDGQFEQQVALKVIRRGFDTEDITRRFLQERQILARLQHPHIARLYDGGIDDNGRPYFAMEHVVGEPLTAYCDERQLGIEARLQLFAQVGEAVQFAHRNLIVHRDLKPSNIFVTEDASGKASVKLLDFGIAKVLQEETSADGIALTQTGARVLTPEYAAPEQLTGDPLTTATDVYSMGVVLYELLTGHRPYHFERNTLGAVERAVLETEPVRPSTAVNRTEDRQHSDGTTEILTPEVISRARSTEPARLRRRLAGDLDTITLKALRKEPDRRYASAETFVEDIKRYLAGLPVEARPDTAGYRMRKFVQRHRLGVSAAMIVVLALVGGLTVALWQQQIATAERDRAQTEAAKADEVATFLRSLFQVSDPYAAGTLADSLTARQLLNQGATRLQTDLEDQPEVLGMLLAEIGRIYRNMGLLESADSMLHAALDLQRQTLGANHSDVGATLYEIALLKDGLGDYAAAETYVRESLDVRRASLGEQHPETAESMDWLATSLAYEYAYEEAIPLSRQALSILQTTVGDADKRTLTAMHNLAWILYSQGNYAEAEPLFRQTITLADSVDAGSPETAITIRTLASLLRLKGEYDESEILLREALQRQRTHLDPMHNDIGVTLNSLAKVLQAKNDLEGAATAYTESLDLLRKSLGPKHVNVSVVMSNLGQVEYERGHLNEAETLQRRALALQTAQLPDEHSYLSSTRVALGRTLLTRHRYDEAEDLLHEALVSRQEQYKEGHWGIAEVQLLLGQVLTAQQRYDEAEPLLQASHTFLHTDRGETDPLTQKAQQALDTLYNIWDKPDIATHAAGTNP